MICSARVPLLSSLLLLCVPVLVAADDPPADEGTLSAVEFRPPVFSPGWSPDVRDVTGIGFALTRRMPVSLEIFQDGALRRTVPTGDVIGSEGQRIGRCFWNGRDGDGLALADGQAVVQFFTPVQLAWRLGGFDDPQPGLIQRPHAVAADAAGNLYVASTGGLMQVFSAAGEFVRFLGPKFEGLPRGYRTISAMAFRDGKLVALCGRQVIELAPDGSAGRVMFDLPEELGSADWLDGIGVDHAGNLYVGSAKTGQIAVLAADGKPVRRIGGKDVFDHLQDFAVAPDGTVYATDRAPQAGGAAAAGRLSVFDRNGKRVRTVLTIYGGGPIPMAAPRCAAVLEDGSIVLAEGAGGPVGPMPMLKAFAHLSADGRLLASWGQRGAGEGEVWFISRLAAVGNEVLAADTYCNHRVLRMKADGTLVRTFQTPPGKFAAVTGILKLEADRYLLLDNGLDRCTEIAADGSVVRCWPYWHLDPVLAGGLTAPGVAATADGLCMVGPTRMLFIDREGKLQRAVTLEGKLPVSGASPGVYIHDGQRAIVTNGEPVAIDSLFAERAEVRIYDLTGKLLASAGGSSRLFGHICPSDGDPDTVYIQRVIEGKTKGREVVAVSEVRIGKQGELRLVRTVPLGSDRAPFYGTSGPFAAGGGRLFKAAGAVHGFDPRTGAFLWSLGSMRDKPVNASAICADGDRLLFASHGTGTVECWSIGGEHKLAEATVTIDNTPPVVSLRGTDQMATCGDAKFQLFGSATDGEGHFEKYEVSYRPRSADPTKPAPWRRVRGDFTQPVSDGLLAEWQVARSLRNQGIDVRVVAYDTAGNSSDSGPAAVVFDDDGDGFSNPEELAAGTDPTKPTQVAGEGDVLVQAELPLLLTPYLFANTAHQLKFTAYDVRDKANPLPLRNARLQYAATGGTFAGGSVGEGGGSTVETTAGRAAWTAPQVELTTAGNAAEGLQVTDTTEVELTVTFPAQSVANVQYKQAQATLRLRVTRDDDHDWLPDGQEVAAADADTRPGAGLRGNPDSDGDGVIDGYDIAPRASYGDADWSTTYYPGMFRNVMDLHFVGIGGGQSYVTKYGDRLSGNNILRSERLDSIDKITPFLNDLWFKQDARNADDRDPFKITSWRGFSQIPSEQEIKLNNGEPYTYSGTGHPSYYFHYWTRESEGTAVMENWRTLDGRTYADAGMHRNYLRACAPACDDLVPRSVAIQFRITGPDANNYAPGKLSYTRAAWMVEVFSDETLARRLDDDGHETDEVIGTALRGENCTWSGIAVAGPVDGRLYEARCEIPAEGVLRRCPVFLKLTPFWLCRSGGPRTCRACGQADDGTHDACARCGAPLPDRYVFNPLDKGRLVVSGVSVFSSDAYVEWIRRMTPREGKPLDQDVFDAIQAAVQQQLTTAGNWPMADGVASYTPTVNGVAYSVEVVSTRGMNKYPNSLSKAQRDEHVAQRVAQINTKVGSADVICLVANSEEDFADLFTAADWGAAGTWVKPGMSLQQFAGQAGGTTATQPAGPQQQDNQESALKTVLSGIEKANGLIRIRNSLTGGFNDVASWGRVRSMYKLGDGDAVVIPARNFGGKSYQGTDGLMVTDDCLSIQKCEGGTFRVSTCHTTYKPYAEFTDPKTGIHITDRGKRTYVGRRTVVEGEFEDLDDSKLFEKATNIDAVRRPKLTSALKGVGNGLKIGAAVVNAGLQIYSAWQDGDKVGVAVYCVTGAADVGQTIAEVAGAEGVLVDGLKLGKTGAAKLNVVGAAIGVVETGYKAYKYFTAETPLEKQAALEDTSACAIDAAIGAIEPWGGLVMASFNLGANIGKLIVVLSGGEVSPITQRATSSIGGALVFLPLHWLPLSCPSSIAQDAASHAQTDAIEMVDTRNLRRDRGTTWVFVPPQ